MPLLRGDFLRCNLSYLKQEGIMSTAIRIDQTDLPFEHWDDPARGNVLFKTLICAQRTPSNSLVCGLASMRAGDTFALHSHPQAEVYFGLQGQGDVMIDGQSYSMSPGVALFIPGGAVHGVPIAQGDLQWFYTFAVDRFDQIAYQFSPV